MELYDSLVNYIVENQNKFYRLAYSYVRNQEDAMDVVQNAIYKALKKSDTLRNENAMRTWFYSILVNESLMTIKARKQDAPLAEDNLNEPVYIEKGFELQSEIYEKINSLEETEQSIIRLRFFEEMSLNEIALVLNINISTVKSKLYRALKKMKIMIEEENLI